MATLSPQAPSVDLLARLKSLPLMPADATWLSIAQALVPIAVALAVGYVALRQWLTAREKLKFDLFGKRWEVYFATVKALSQITQNDGLTEQQISDFSIAIASARFLFSKNIHVYLRDVMYRMIDFIVLKAELPRQEPAQQAASSARLKDEISWFRNELNNLDKPFKRYMQLTH
jgi:hypothetical protein